MQSRGIAYGIISMIYLPFVFVGPSIAAGIGLTRWRWGYGMFCILMPMCVCPLFGLLANADIVKRRAKRCAEGEGTAQPPDAGKRTGLYGWRRVSNSLVLVDPLGLLLTGFSFSLLLVPPTLSAGAKGGWHNRSMIAMEVSGGIVLIMLAVWELRYAPYPIFPRRMFNRNFVLCLCIEVLYFLNGSLLTTYWSSWVWVVRDYSQHQWTYICETGTASLCIFTLVAGLIIRWTKRYKIMLIIGVIISIVGCAVSYYSSLSGHTSTVALVFGQLLFQAGGGFALTPAQTVLQGSVSAQDLAMAVALLIFSETMGSAIGASIAGAVWTRTLVYNLSISAPSLNSTQIVEIAGDITAARTAEPRAAIIIAYNYAFRKLALVLLIFSFVPMIMAVIVKDFALDARQNAIDGSQEQDGAVEPDSQQADAVDKAAEGSRTLND